MFNLRAFRECRAFVDEMARPRARRWSRAESPGATFAEEIVGAVEIEARFESSGYQRDIILAEISGWQSPLWGSDDAWLYIKRPQGLWKARIPQGFDQDDTPCLLYQERSGPEGARSIGCLSIGHSLSSQGGWHAGRPGAPMKASDLDDRLWPRALGVDLPADAVGQPLWKQFSLPCEGPGLLMGADDDFCSPPRFFRWGSWLIAEEHGSGWRMAYPIEEGSEVHKALEAGHLWLRFRGAWLCALDVQVAIFPSGA